MLTSSAKFWLISCIKLSPPALGGERKEENVNNKSLEKEQNITETNSWRINYVITKMIRKYRILLLIKGNK